MPTEHVPGSSPPIANSPRHRDPEGRADVSLELSPASRGIPFRARDSAMYSMAVGPGGRAEAGFEVFQTLNELAVLGYFPTVRAARYAVFETRAGKP